MNLTKEDKEFIKDLSHEMNTQDTRCTAQPYGLIIGKKTRQMTDWNEATHEAIYWDEDNYDTFEKFIKDIEEVYEDNDDKEAVQLIKENCSSISDVKIWEDEINELLYTPCRVYGYNIVDDFNPDRGFTGNFFLTEKEAFKYIEKSRHDLFTYGIHLYRNNEMKKLLQIVHKLAKGLEDE